MGGPEVLAALKLRDEMSAPLHAATQSVGVNFGGMLGMLAGPVAAVAALGSAVAAFAVTAVQKTVDAGQEAYTMGQRFGLANEQASEWLSVSRHLGVDSDALGSGF